MTLSGTVQTIINFLLTGTGDLGTPTAPVAASNLITFTNGTGANQAQNVFGDTRSLAASTSEDLDLSGTTLQNGLGVDIGLTAVKLLYVKAASTNGGTLSVGGASSNGFISWVGAATDVVKLRPGGILLLVAPDATGYAVTASTADLLTVANDDSGAAASYDIVVVGE